mgnify:CR=1 FL=1
MLICGILGIFYLATVAVILFGPIFLKEIEIIERKSEGRAILFLIIFYVGAFTIARWVFKILDNTSGEHG